MRKSRKRKKEIVERGEIFRIELEKNKGNIWMFEDLHKINNKI